jgi:hypothetical protein
MSNISSAKAAAQKGAVVAAIITPPPVIQGKAKRTTAPRSKDMDLIQSTLTGNIRTKAQGIRYAEAERAKKTLAPLIKQIQSKAVMLAEDIKDLEKAIERESNGLARLPAGSYSGSYSSWLNNLPTTRTHAEAAEYIDTSGKDVPGIANLQAEVDKQILNIRLGIQPVTDVKALMDLINNFK